LLKATIGNWQLSKQTNYTKALCDNLRIVFLALTQKAIKR
jgi:hypothetical protein